MKNFFLIILFLMISTYTSLSLCDASTSANATSKTFFSVPPIFRPSSPEIVSITRDLLRFDNPKKIYFDITPFGGASGNKSGMARFFLPFDKQTVLVGELGSPLAKQGSADLIANYFGVLTAAAPTASDPVDSTLNNYTFESILTFAPKQTFYGVTLSYKQHLSRYSDRGFWFDIVLPVEHVRNDMHLCERIIRKGGPTGDNPEVPVGSVANMRQAFRQPSWQFGKIEGPKSHTGLADLYLRFGYLYVKEETHYLTSFVGLSAPTGNEVKGEFVFEPIVGMNQNITFFSGTSAGFRVWSKCEKAIHFTFDLAGTVFFSNTQTRSFDLKDKSWSRYMWVYLDKTSTVTSPGINVFTKRVDVAPGSSRDLNLAWIYKDKGLQVEAGYHFFGRHAEDVKLSAPWKKGPAIAAIIKDGNFISSGTSRNAATINNYMGVLNDTINGVEVFKEIEECDLNLDSAAMPGGLSHNAYFSVSYNWDNCKHPKFIGGGASYEFASNNAILERVMAWVKLGIYF